MRLAVFSLTSLIGDGPVICTMKLGFLYPRRCASSVGPPLSATSFLRLARRVCSIPIQSEYRRLFYFATAK